MRWTDVNTKPQLLVKYKDFFEPANHEQIVAQIDQAFPHKRPKLMEGEWSFNDDDRNREDEKDTPAAIFSVGGRNERSKQLKLNLI